MGDRRRRRPPPPPSQPDGGGAGADLFPAEADQPQPGGVCRARFDGPGGAGRPDSRDTLSRLDPAAPDLRGAPAGRVPDRGERRAAIHDDPRRGVRRGGAASLLRRAVRGRRLLGGAAAPGVRRAHGAGRPSAGRCGRSCCARACASPRPAFVLGIPAAAWPRGSCAPSSSASRRGTRPATRSPWRSWGSPRFSRPGPPRGARRRRALEALRAD